MSEVHPRALQTVLDGRFAAVREDVRAQLGDVGLVTDPNLDTETYRARVREWLDRLVESGRPRSGFDPAYGGGGDVGGVVSAFQMLGYGDLSLLVKAGVQWGLFGGAVQALGTARHHERYLGPIMDGTLIGCFAMTETGHGSDVQHLCTTATYDAGTGEFVVHTPDAAARKDYIGGAARDASVAAVFAQLETNGETHGVHALLVPIRDADGAPSPGVTISDCGRKAGLNGVDNGRLYFDHVRVPREALLDRYGAVAADGTYSSPIENETRRFFTMLGTLVRGRISVAGGAGAATQKALTLAIRYGEQRRQFANPATGEEVVVLDYLAHQRKLLPALATTYALQFAQEELVSVMHEVQGFGAELTEGPLAGPSISTEGPLAGPSISTEGPLAGPSISTEGPLAGPSSDTEGPLAGPSSDTEQAQRELEQRAAGVKAVGTWHATATIQTCREACGGAGYLAENLLPALKADTDVFTTFEGDNTVLLQLVAKGLLSDYARGFTRRGPLGKARFVAGQVLGAAVERSGVRPVLTRGDVRDRAHQRRLVAEREQHMLAALAQRLRAALAPGADQFAVFNAAQDHLLRTARAHVDRIVLDAFDAAVDRVVDPAVRDLLEQVRELHVLATIEAERAWYLEHGYLTPARTRAVTRAVDELCRALRPHARTLVDAFGIPENWLAAPMLGAGERAAAQGGADPADLAAVG